MGEVSIIEFLVYALIAYTGMVLLIASAFKETPSTKSQSVVRVIWLIPSIFAAFMLGSIGGFDIIDSTEVETVISDYEILNSTEIIVLNSTTTHTTTDKYTLLNPVWTTLHLLFFVIMLLYVIINILMLLVKRD